MRKLLPVAIVAASLLAGAAVAQPAATPAAPAAAPAAAAPAPGGKLSAASSLLAIYKSPTGKEVLKKHIPQVVDFLDSNGTDMIPPEMTLNDLTGIAEAGVTADMVTAIGKDLAAL